MTEPQVRVLAAAATSPGLVRERNEDSHLVAPPVFLVADGLGGHARGAAASQAVARTFARFAGQPWLTAEDLLGAVDDACAAVASLAAGGGAPGSTVSGVGLADHGGMPCWLVFNIGDSRTYLLDQGRMDQLTVDHSAVHRGDGPDPRLRNVITRAIGAGTRRAPVTDQWLVPAGTGQRVLICSDGLTSEVTDLLIHACLLSEADPQAAADRLVETALEAGGRDNITVVVVDATAVTSRVGKDADSDTRPDRTEPDGLFDSAESVGTEGIWDVPERADHGDRARRSA